MASPRKYIPVELQPELQIEFEEGITPLEVLGARAGMSHDTFAKRARELGWAAKYRNAWGRRMRPGNKTEPVPSNSRRPAVAVTATSPSPPSDAELADKAALAQRLRRNVDRELTAVEQMRKTIDPADFAKFEMVGRLLTGLLRTWQDAVQLEQATRPQPPAKSDDDFPRDHAELRRSLLQHLDAILSEREGAVSGETESA